jgi:NAD(P)-dependent dehydrogenase (short-subunit alcohol dehydrogenase family)
VSLRRVATEAGQRNCNALQYHFGTRELLIDAIVEARMTPLNQRRRALLEEALGRTKGKPSAEDLVVALVVPMVEQLLDVERGSSYVRFMGELFARGEAKGALATPRPWNDAFFETVAHLRRALPSIPEDVLGTRIFLMAGQMVQGHGSGRARGARPRRRRPVGSRHALRGAAGGLRGGCPGCAEPRLAGGARGTRARRAPACDEHGGALVSRRVAIVTGASSGIGYATALQLAQGGFDVVLSARREELLHELARAVEAHGAKAHVVAADLAEGADTTHLAQSALERFGEVDLLVNNAGYGPPFPLEQMDRDALRHVFDVNLLAGMQLVGELTPMWRARGGGRVINMSSLTRYVASPVTSAYAATKAGMEAATRALRIELAPWNVQLSVIIPGFVDTPTFDKAREAGREAREDRANPYQAYLERLDGFAQTQLVRAISPDAVARVVLKAANAKRPQERYFVPFSSRVAALTLGGMPASLDAKRS